MKRITVTLLSLVLLLAATTTLAGAAGRETATDLFVGTATTGVGSPMPIDINPADITFRGDGAIGIGYIYRANGKAQGQMPGSFGYEEHGYLFFFNPADPTTFAGTAFKSGVFTLQPNQPGPAVTIADTDPSAYQSGHNVAGASTAKGALGSILKAYDKNTGLLKGGADLLYGYFTFTNEYGTHTGYATPDFRRFSIEVTFAR